jgi:hypothetical protein
MHRRSLPRVRTGSEEGGDSVLIVDAALRCESASRSLLFRVLYHRRSDLCISLPQKAHPIDASQER